MNYLCKIGGQGRGFEFFSMFCSSGDLALLIGLITGLVGMFNNITVENIAGFKLLLTSNLMVKGK